jgi:hypothetical protein
MYFYVDESGHTGPNLFDHTQPYLFYGTLSSKVNLDVLAEGKLAETRARVSAGRLHANELGNGGLVEIAHDLARIQKKFDLRFDFYRVKKLDHAAIIFFDQVFDQGLNPAVPWTSYWTPLRYPLLLTIASLFDEELLKAAWAARISSNPTHVNEELRNLCGELVRRAQGIEDKRKREIICDGLKWAASNPDEIAYGVVGKADAVSLMPNAVGFQSVMMGIAKRLQGSTRKNIGITVDRQSQFNKEQARLSDWYARLSKVELESGPLKNGPGLPKLDYKGMPDEPIIFSSGEESAGLELVDIYLWIFKRMFEGREVAPELAPIIRRQLVVGATDEISLQAISNRWEPWFKKLEAQEISDEKMAEGRKLMEAHEEFRKKAVSSQTRED